MSRRVSCTVTVGIGSEQHNHDLEYRETLEHVHDMKDGVIEVIPYRPYKEQINEMMRPYIEQYNKRQEARYKSAWDRYNAGLIKTKPRKANYKPMCFDYYSDHVNDQYYNRAEKKTEQMPMFRSLIFGLGDKADREQGTLTESEAVAVMTGVIERWPELYPDFKLLGASIHLDEEGFYHCHIDYKPMFEADKEVKQEQGLRVSVSQEAALEHMGFEPEQSVVNGRDKAPIRFNAFRNRLYLEAEAELNKQGLRLWYGASNDKEPFKDSATNQRLKNWQDTKDGVNELQSLKNSMLDIIANDKVSPNGFKAAVKAAKNIEDTLGRLESQKRSRFNKNNVVVGFGLFDQLLGFVKSLVSTVAHVLKANEQLKKDLEDELEYSKQLEADVDRLKPLEQYDTVDFKMHYNELRGKAARCDKLELENKQLRNQLGLGKEPKDLNLNL